MGRAVTNDQVGDWNVRRVTVGNAVVKLTGPSGFLLWRRAFDIKANVCQMKYVRPLNPPGDQIHTVCWVRKGFGVAPGSDSGGTSYILVVEDGKTRQLPVRVQLNDGRSARVAVIVRRNDSTGAMRETLTELTGREDVIVARQLEIGEGVAVRVGAD